MSKRAFSLAELMIVMLILTIILAATMPILSKRAKVKVAATASSSGNLACMKIVNSSIEPVALSDDIKSLSYTMYGGGGGAGFYYYDSSSAWSVYNSGGGGGSSAIIYDGNVMASAAGGDGGSYSGTGADGKMSSGTLTNLLKGKTFAVYAGGGGGSTGGGGSGYYGGGGAGKGGGTYYGKGGTGTEGGASGGTGGVAGQQFKGGDSSFIRVSTVTASGGVGALGAGSNPSGAGYGGTGNIACTYGSAVSYPSKTEVNTTLGTGKGGIGGQIHINDPTNYSNGFSHCGYGGSGGSVIMFYTTTGSSCFL